MLNIAETTAQDLAAIRALWADGEVMRFVGFPQGLHKTPAEMQAWLERISGRRPRANHYSIYDDGAYCGETFYAIDAQGRAMMDIKLLPAARGRGIAARALRFAIARAFENGAVSAWVDPDPGNEKALALYRRVGMEQKSTPPDLFNPDYPQVLFFEITRDAFLRNT